MIGVYQPQPNRGISKLLRDYERRRENVSIQYQYFPSEQFVALFTAAQQSGQQIDVLLLNGQDIRRYATTGALLPMDDIPYKDRFQELAIKTYTIDGHLWGVPTGSTGGFNIMVNRYLLRQVGAEYPATYDDLVAIAKELRRLGVSAFTHPGKIIYLWPVWFFTTYAQVTRNRSEERTMETLRGDGSFTDPEVVEALDLIFRFARDGLFAPDVLSLDTHGAERAFITGRAAFSLGNYGYTDAVQTQRVPHMDLWAELMPRLVSDKAVKSQFPGGPGAPLCLYKRIPEDHVPSAKDLIAFLTSNESDRYLVRDAHAALGVNKGVLGDNSPLTVQLGKLLPHMTVYLDWFWPPEVTQAFQQGIQAGVAGQKSAQQVARDIQAVFDRLRKQGYKFQG